MQLNRSRAFLPGKGLPLGREYFVRDRDMQRYAKFLSFGKDGRMHGCYGRGCFINLERLKSKSRMFAFVEGSSNYSRFEMTLTKYFESRHNIKT